MDDTRNSKIYENTEYEKKNKTNNRQKLLTSNGRKKNAAGWTCFVKAQPYPLLMCNKQTLSNKKKTSKARLKISPSPMSEKAINFKES